MLLGNEIPSFAGFFRDTVTGNLVAYVADSADIEPARLAIRQHLSAHDIGLPRFFRPGEVVIRKGEYRFQQLSDWRDLVTDSILGRYAGVNFDDLDEMVNRVTIGLPASRQAELLPILDRLGIPRAAVRLRDIDQIWLATGAHRSSTRPPYVGSIDGRADSISGGFPVQTRQGGDCTLGYVSQMFQGAYFAVTASHCTPTFWGLDTTTMGQPGLGSRNIGFEFSDIAGMSCTLTCNTERYSDASVFELYASDSVKQGFLPRLNDRESGGPGTDTISTTNPWLTIAGSEPAVGGFQVDMVGYITGRTYGYVTGTCTDESTGTWPNNQRRLCQGIASVWSQGGDSGAPVFVWDGLDGVQLWGINWGAVCQPPCNGVNVSTIADIETDFGSYAAHPETNITVSAPSISGSISGGVPTITWSAVSTTHTSGTTVYYILRSTWDASTYTWVDNGAVVGTTTSTSYTDTSVPVALNSYAGGPPSPAECTYTYVQYNVRAYNTGVGNTSDAIFFQGAANGPDPNQITCP